MPPERLITPQNLLCLWSKITRNASLSMVCSHVRPLNLCQMPLRNFGQNANFNISKNVFCYVGFWNSLLSRTVQFTICAVTFLRSNRIDWIQITFRKLLAVTPQGKIYNAREITVSFKKNNSEGFVGASLIYFFIWELDFLNFEKGPNRNQYVEYLGTYGSSKINITSLWRSDASISASHKFRR